MRKTVRFNKNTLIYSKGMSTQDCLDVLNKRYDKRAEEMKIYEPFYKKYVSLQKKQEEDLSWIRHLKRYPNFIEGSKNET